MSQLDFSWLESKACKSLLSWLRVGVVDVDVRPTTVLCLFCLLFCFCLIFLPSLPISERLLLLLVLSNCVALFFDCLIAFILCVYSKHFLCHLSYCRISYISVLFFVYEYFLTVVFVCLRDEKLVCKFANYQEPSTLYHCMLAWVYRKDFFVFFSALLH